jgi:isoleucyl-tRNA synthetase
MSDVKKSNLALIEEDMHDVWAKEDTFQKSMDQRQGGPYFSFYDGPPFANGLPHFGHSLVTSIKDSVLRYKTMRGYYVPRRNGWDCHGLPVEYAIEKEFGVSGKKQILELGLEKFNQACNDSIFKYKGEWEVLLRRLGRWSEYDHYYATVDNSYTESVWWAMSQINSKGLLYRGFKSTAYCPRCETPLSNFEVNDGYKDNVPDPSLYVKFKLANEDAYLLGWTTTPWSLPGNAAIAVNPEEKYVYVRLTNGNGKEEVLVLAQKRLEVLTSEDFHVEKEVHGRDLVGLSYEPLFEVEQAQTAEGRENLYKVWAADFVSIDDGSGVLHVAPAFGEDDLNLGQANNIPVLKTIDASGKVVAGIGFDDVKGKFFKSADKYIIEHLTQQGQVYSAQTFTHTYPFCWRCETPLMYYAISSWFIGVSSIRDQLIKTAEEINWVPEHIKTGRFGKWLEGARDWAVSRNRYWGAPMPVWVNEDDEDDYLVIESYDQLRELAGQPELDLSDVHRPKVDDVVIKKDGKTYRRVEEVIDCWFESGCMSIGQQHYPFENKETFEKTFPADFIIEGLDQTRLWFYVQHVVNTILFDSPAYKNVIVNGMIMAADGQKLSKRLKNYPPVEEVFNDEGADSLRLFLLSSTQATQTADYMRFDRDSLKDLNRNVLGTLMNSHRFFKMYADIDDWKPAKPGFQPESASSLDQWIIARLNETVIEVTKQADNFKLAHAIQPIFALIDDMSNWYIRRSRRRFWKTEDDIDKEQAYETLWYVLMRICQLLAPWAPFLSDYLWRELTSDTDLPQSVHLCDWPEVVLNPKDKALILYMRGARGYIVAGLAQRAKAGIKVRQPLRTFKLPGTKQEWLKTPGILEIIADELNVKNIDYSDKKIDLTKTIEHQINEQDLLPFSEMVELDTTITPELKREGIMREIVRHVQNARKKAGLNVDDRIELSLVSGDKEVLQAIKEHNTTIAAETLATKFNNEPTALKYTEAVTLEGSELTINLQKA